LTSLPRHLALRTEAGVGRIRAEHQKMLNFQSWRLIYSGAEGMAK
jgi:hypothetical protein